MPRSRRIQYAGAWHHLMNRGASRRLIFLDDLDRTMMLSLLADAVDKFGVEVHAYCLMGNHYHLLVRTPEPNLDQFMHSIFFKYVRFFNDRHGHDGSLFRDRYHALPVQDVAYVASLIRYIHRNPIALGVTDLASYRWSSHGAYLTGNSPSWLTTSTGLAVAGGRAGLRAMVDDDTTTDVDLYLHGGENVAIGSDAFVEKMRRSA